MKIKLIEDGKMPEYKTEWAAGADCYARKGTTVKPGETKVIPLGVALEIPLVAGITDIHFRSPHI